MKISTVEIDKMLKDWPRVVNRKELGEILSDKINLLLLK